MDILWNTFYFVVALGILVTIHEFGHFWVARKLGVRVLTFSVGFGKPLWQRKGNDGVNYIIAAIPLGGYVKMLDEREAEVFPEEKQFAFNRKPVWARIAIVLAGPIANFILAFFLYSIVYGIGIRGLNTQVGNVIPQSISALAGLKSGDLITQVDGAAVYNTSDLIKRLAVRMGDKDRIELSLVNANTNLTRTAWLELSNWEVNQKAPNILKSLGIVHQIEELMPIIGHVESNGIANNSGIMKGDVILEIDNEVIKTWNEFVKKVRKRPNKEVMLLVERDGELLDIFMVIGSRKGEESDIGYIGVGSNASDLYILRKGNSLLDSFRIGFNETSNMLILSTKLFFKLVTGELSLKSLSGPLSIAEGAGRSASIGLVYFLSFVAMISVNLGFINLLPIPLLDGGHLLYFVVEAIKGKPLSIKVQEIGLQIGMLMVFALMAIAIFNDFSRL